jgi:hypothetical protein
MEMDAAANNEATNEEGGSTKDSDRVIEGIVWDALQKTLQLGVFTGDTKTTTNKPLSRSEYCLRPSVRKDNGLLKFEATNCQCVHTMSSLLDEQEGTGRKQLSELSRWFSEVQHKATSRGGSWRIATNYIRECCVKGGGGQQTPVK